MRKLEIINYLRGFAIFTIVLMHCLQGYLDGMMPMWMVLMICLLVSYTMAFAFTFRRTTLNLRESEFMRYMLDTCAFIDAVTED